MARAMRNPYLLGTEGYLRPLEQAAPAEGHARPNDPEAPRTPPARAGVHRGALGRRDRPRVVARRARLRMSGFEVRHARSDELARCLAIRREVFVDEQGVPIEAEMDAHDAACTHFLALAAGEAV